MRSARQRELPALAPATLLLAPSFAAVFAQKNARLGNLSLIYGAYLLVICLATHIYLRIRLRNADPNLFTPAALLAAFGLAMTSNRPSREATAPRRAALVPEVA